MHVILECRCYRELDIDTIERLLEKNFGKSFHYSYAHKEHCHWVCKFIVDKATIPAILDVVKTSACTHINCYVGEEECLIGLERKKSLRSLSYSIV